MTSKKDTKPTLLDHARQERRDYGGNSIWDWSNFHLAGRLGEIEEEYMNEAILDDPIIVECWKYKNEDAQSGFALSYDEVKYIKEEDIPAWLAQSPQSNRRPCAGLRLIHQFQGFKNCRTLAAISDKFGVPDVFSHLTSANTGSCGKFMSEDARSVILVCNRTIARSTVSIVVRHDFETEITKGYIFSEMTTMIHHALLGIPQQFQGLTHPLLVPSLIVELMLSAASGLQASIDDDLADIARATGFHDGEGYEFIGGLQDYRQISKDLGRVATRFAFAKSRILGIKATHEFCSRNLRSCESWIPEDKWDNYRESTRILLERSEYVASHIEHLLMYRCIEMRLQVQQSVIFNLIAQEDNRTNIQLSGEMRQIAIKTKRDGSIMKTIAFLGALFVPATFVSTVFAMPLFNWSASTTSEIITNRFWIYGAVAGPLTIVTMMIVGYWILSRTQKNLDEKDPTSNGPRPSRFERLKEKLEFRKVQPPKPGDGV